jgi:hypothetical protein
MLKPVVMRHMAESIRRALDSPAPSPAGGTTKHASAFAAPAPAGILARAERRMGENA